MISTEDIEAAKLLGSAGEVEVIHPRWVPPDEKRVEMQVHPDAREALRSLLQNDPTARGVGYSEFLMWAVGAWKDQFE